MAVPLPFGFSCARSGGVRSFSHGPAMRQGFGGQHCTTLAGAGLQRSLPSRSFLLEAERCYCVQFVSLLCLLWCRSVVHTGQHRGTHGGTTKSRRPRGTSATESMASAAVGSSGKKELCRPGLYSPYQHRAADWHSSRRRRRCSSLLIARSALRCRCDAAHHVQPS